MLVKSVTVPLADVRSAIFLKWMMDGSKVLIPEVVDGKITYPDVTRLVPAVEPLEFVEQLVTQSILIKEKHVSEIVCPSCGSSKLKDTYACMFCHGDNIDTGEMIEHYACGNTDFDANFEKNEKLICSKCLKELKVIGTDYRRVGKVFKCKDCGKDSSIPRITHHCQNCGTAFTWEQARLRVLYKYRIDEKKKREIDSLTGIYLPLVEFLQKERFEVQSPALVKGQSGIEHPFDILGRAENKQILLDIVADRESVGEAAVITFFSKVLDVPHDECVLICVPKASDRTKALCKLYGITVVEGDGIAQILNSMDALSLKGSATHYRPDELKAAIEIPSTQGGLDTHRMNLHVGMPATNEHATEPNEEKAEGEPRAPRLETSTPQEVREETPDQNRMLQEGAQTTGNQSFDVNLPNTISPITEPARTVVEDERLQELESLHREGKMAIDEYRANRERILRQVNARPEQHRLA